MGLEERLEFSQTTTTPLILPPPALRTNVNHSLLGERTSTDSLTPPASIDAAELITNPVVNDTAISTSNTATEVQDTASEAHSPRSASGDADTTTSTTKEAELTVLKDSILKLQEKLAQSHQECSVLQQREHTLQLTLDKETKSEVKDVSRPEIYLPFLNRQSHCDSEWQW